MDQISKIKGQSISTLDYIKSSVLNTLPYNFFYIYADQKCNVVINNMYSLKRVYSQTDNVHLHFFNVPRAHFFLQKITFYIHERLVSVRTDKNALIYNKSAASKITCMYIYAYEIGIIKHEMLKKIRWKKKDCAWFRRV